MAAKKLNSNAAVQARVSIELSRVLELLELRLERYTPVAPIVPPAKDDKLMSELKALQEPRDEEEPPAKRSRQERVREPALDFPGEQKASSFTLPRWSHVPWHQSATSSPPAAVQASD